MTPLPAGTGAGLSLTTVDIAQSVETYFNGSWMLVREIALGSFESTLGAYVTW